MSGTQHSQEESTDVEKRNKVEDFIIQNEIGNIISEEGRIIVSLDEMSHAREVCDTVLDEPDFAEKMFEDAGSTSNVIHTLVENIQKIEKKNINRTDVLDYDTLYYDADSLEEGYGVLSTDYATEEVSEEDVDFDFENLDLRNDSCTEISHYDFRAMSSLGWF